MTSGLQSGLVLIDSFLELCSDKSFRMMILVSTMKAPEKLNLCILGSVN